MTMISGIESDASGVSIKLRLIRFCYAEFGVFGWIMAGGRTLWTIERAWVGNEPNLSCIPEGIYRYRRGFFYRGDYPALELEDVPGRSLIKCHRANWPRQLLGCIAPNLSLGPGDWSCPMRGYQSELALRVLLAHAGKAGQLEIARWPKDEDVAYS